MIDGGASPLVEPGLGELLAEVTTAGRLRATTSTDARLGGANRCYVEEEMPHIVSLVCETTDALLAHAEALVVANADEQARQAVAATRPDHLVIDLGRGGVSRS
jgi:hypothetical protein